jgi:hypothetical protein
VVIWKDKEIVTFGDLADAMRAIVETGTEKDAQELMSLYRAEEPEFADGNVGYIAGYFDAATAKRIWAWFGTRHPIFGTVYPEV